MTDTRNTKDGTFVVDGNRIDRESQKILIRLNESQWTYATSLRENAELSQNGQVFYRMEEHLIPAGLVEEAGREDDATAYRGRRQFRLTAAGASWLSDHEETVAVPKSRAETQQMVYEANEAAESARDSVQSYRKDLHRLKKDVEETTDKVDEWMDTKNNHWQDLERRSSRTRTLAEDNAQSIESVEDRVSSIERNRSQSVQNTAARFTDNEDSIEELREENATLRKEVEELQAVVVEMGEEMNRGRIDKLRRRFS